MQIVVGGDVFVGGDAQQHPSGVQIISKTYANADLRIVNLEHPLSDHPEYENKGVLFASIKANKILKNLRIDAVNLANNHIHDKTKAGIQDTFVCLERVDIGHFGAGMSLDSAKRPHWITDSLCIMGYCVQGKPTLTKVGVATATDAGVNLCTYKEIEHDLDLLPEGMRAIIYCHWGREHVWCASEYVIDLAKQLLNHERVVLVVGSHPHLVQGIIRRNGKCAYLSLGNFLFSNFYIAPPTQLVYPDDTPNALTTRKYHCVRALTYKKWPWWNRIALLVNYDAQSGKSSYAITMQDDNHPVVTELDGVSALLVKGWVETLTWIYTLPYPIYSGLQKCNGLWVTGTWFVGINLFYIRQKGVKWFVLKLWKTGKRSLKKCGATK